MAMAYCSTCGAMGNWVKCPNRFEPEDDGTYLMHRVEYDEVIYDDPNSDNNSDNTGSDGAG